MPRSREKFGGAGTAPKKAKQGSSPKNQMSRKAPSKSKGGSLASDDMPLSPDIPYEEGAGEEGYVQQEPSIAEPFTDGIVSPRLKGLTVVPRAGGEDVAVLHDFLLLFAKTETFIGAISSKTSFMKKAGGRLM